MKRRAASAAAASVLPVLLVVAGCGVGPQSHPVSLGSGTPSWAPTGGAAGALGHRATALLVSVFLVHGDEIVPTWRPSAGGLDLDAVLATLVERPSRKERAEQLRTAIPASATHIRATIRDHVALVQVPAGFGTLPNRERVLAVAQVLYTLTAQLSVSSLRLVNGSHAIDTPVGSGQLVSRPVTRDDFAALAPDIP